MLEQGGRGGGVRQAPMSNLEKPSSPHTIMTKQSGGRSSRDPRTVVFELVFGTRFEQQSHDNMEYFLSCGLVSKGVDGNVQCKCSPCRSPFGSIVA